LLSIPAGFDLRPVRRSAHFVMLWRWAGGLDGCLTGARRLFVAAMILEFTHVYMHCGKGPFLGCRLGRVSGTNVVWLLSSTYLTYLGRSPTLIHMTYRVCRPCQRHLVARMETSLPYDSSQVRHSGMGISSSLRSPISLNIHAMTKGSAEHGHSWERSPSLDAM